MNALVASTDLLEKRTVVLTAHEETLGGAHTRPNSPRLRQTEGPIGVAKNKREEVILRLTSTVYCWDGWGGW